MNSPHYTAFPAIVGTGGQYSKMRRTWDSHHHKYHKDRLKKVQATVDNRALKHLQGQVNRKKKLMEEENWNELMRDNRLLEARIIRAKSKTTLDNWNDYQLRSKLKTEANLRDKLRIALENKIILEKIEKAKSAYDHKKLHEEYKLNKGCMSRLSKYSQEPKAFRMLPPLNLC